MKKLVRQDVITQTVFGHPTDFLIENWIDGDKLTLTITASLPRIAFKDGLFVSFAGERYPWGKKQKP